MFFNHEFYFLFFTAYSFYGLASYKYIREYKINEIHNKFLVYNDWLIKQMKPTIEDYDKIALAESEEMSKWSIGTLFLNKILFKISIVLLLIDFGYIIDLFGLKSLLIIIAGVFISQIIIGNILKGKALQTSALIAFLIALSIRIFYYRELFI